MLDLESVVVPVYSFQAVTYPPATLSRREGVCSPTDPVRLRLSRTGKCVGVRAAPNSGRFSSDPEACWCRTSFFACIPFARGCLGGCTLEFACLKTMRFGLRRSVCSCSEYVHGVSEGRNLLGWRARTEARRRF